MASTYEKIATNTLGSTTSSVTFSSIPATYTDLVIVCSARSSYTGGTSAPININFNSDTGANYSNVFMYGNGTTAGTSRASNGNYIYTADISAVGGTGFAGFGNLIININNYSNTTTNKTTLARTSSPNSFVEAVCGLWRNTSAIGSIDLTVTLGDFVVGSTFTLYGILKAA